MTILGKAILNRTNGMAISGYIYIKHTSLYAACVDANTTYTVGLERCRLLGVMVL